MKYCVCGFKIWKDHLHQLLKSFKTSTWILKTSVIGLTVLLLFSAGSRFNYIHNSKPYPRHLDESFIVNSANNVIHSPGLDPHQFMYPSVPVYLIAFGEITGYFIEKIRGKVNRISDLSRTILPYYDQPNIIWPAKYLFSFFSLIVLLLVALLAYNLTSQPLSLILAPGILCLSELFLLHSRQYINTDIVCSLVVTSGILYLCCTWGKNNLTHRLIIPGVVCGLAVACKYTHGILVLPFIIALKNQCPENKIFSRHTIFFRQTLGLFKYLGITDENKIFLRYTMFFRQILGLFICLGMTFVLAMPYSVIRLKDFILDLNHERINYLYGHVGHTSNPGWDHLVYQAKGLWDNFGFGAWLLGIFGIFWIVKTYRKKGLAVIAYPVLFTLYFCLHKTNFYRNMLPVYALFSVFVTCGTLGLYGYIKQYLDKYFSEKNVFLPRGIVIVGISSLIFFTAPLKKMVLEYQSMTESRNEAVKWIQTVVPEGSNIVVAERLCLDYRPLKNNYNIQELLLQRTDWSNEEKEEIENLKAYFLVPEYGYDHRWPVNKKMADTYNDQYSRNTIIKEFQGSSPVMITIKLPAPHGNPSFSIRNGLRFSDKQSQ